MKPGMVLRVSMSAAEIAASVNRPPRRVTAEELTRERIAELQRAGDERGDHRINDLEVQEADFVVNDIPGLTWGELRELLDAWKSEDGRVG